MLVTVNILLAFLNFLHFETFCFGSTQKETNT